MNCATNGQVTLNELVKEINKLMQKQIEPIYDSIRPGDIKHSFAAIDLIKKQLKWKPKYSFNEGLEITIDSTYY